MHFVNKKFIGISLLLIIIGLTLSAVTSVQNQSARAGKSLYLNGTNNKSARALTGTIGRNGDARFKNNFVVGVKLPIPSSTVYPVPPLTRDDLYDHMLGCSKGGTTTAAVECYPQYMRPGSRYKEAGDNEFDAVLAIVYYNQLKAHIAYLDVVFNYPNDKIDTIVDNIASGSAVQLRTQEADTLLKVAVIYKGDICGFGEYNNPAMKQVLVKWGRSDLANEPGVGETDVESIALVAQAIDEEPNPEVRRQWLGEIYAFYDNINPRSPSGAVPQLREYQCAIDASVDGTMERLIDNFVKGIKTSYLIDPTPGGRGYPFLAPLTPLPLTPTFTCLGGPCITPSVSPSIEQPTQVIAPPIPSTAPVPPPASQQSGGLLQWFILLLMLVVGLIK